MKNSPSEGLNQVLAEKAPALLAMLSQKGKEVYFPHSGILGQTAQAKGKKYNATIGIAKEEDGSPMRLNALLDPLDLKPGEVLPYAPSFGVPALRDRWADMIRSKNPSLGSAAFSRPVVTQALTHGLTIGAYLFLNEGDELLIPEPYWDNYNLLFETSFGAKIKGFNCFKDGGFDLQALKAQLDQRQGQKITLLLNFPNNPTGYTPTSSEMEQITQTLIQSAEQGSQIVVMIDDAYFGLVYEEGIAQESIFAALANAHENILAFKIDGATKEDYVWGLRVGFVTFANKGADEEVYKVLADKAGGSIRGMISNTSHLSQTLMLKAYESSDYESEKQEKYELMKARYLKLKSCLESHPEYSELFEPLPYNSGYFMCVQPVEGIDAEAVRKKLIEDYDTGIIALSGLIRIAFSSIPTEDIPELMNRIAQACRDIKG